MWQHRMTWVVSITLLIGVASLSTWSDAARGWTGAEALQATSTATVFTVPTFVFPTPIPFHTLAIPTVAPFPTLPRVATATSNPLPASAPTAANGSTPTSGATIANAPGISSIATLSQAVMAQDVKAGTYEPIGVTDAYPAGQGRVHAVVTVADAKNDTQLKAVWMALHEGNPAAPSTQLGETDITIGDIKYTTTSGPRNVDLTFVPKGGHFAPGNYEVDVYLDGQYNLSLFFTVAEGTTQPTPTLTPVALVPTPVTGVRMIFFGRLFFLAHALTETSAFDSGRSPR